jgi:diadenosine tetraphosphate (Ap4A) HIT family hydrolase
VSEGCLVCRQVTGEFELPGGLLWDDAEAIGFHLPPTDANPRPYIGHCMIVTRRHVDHLADLTDEETESVARASRALAGALRAEGVERVHVAVIGLGGDHFHQHLYPRYPGAPPAPHGWLLMNSPVRRMEAPRRSPTSRSVFAFISRPDVCHLGPRLGMRLERHRRRVEVFFYCGKESSQSLALSSCGGRCWVATNALLDLLVSSPAVVLPDGHYRGAIL